MSQNLRLASSVLDASALMPWQIALVTSSWHSRFTHDRIPL